jgi:hypothetical protein
MEACSAKLKKPKHRDAILAWRFDRGLVLEWHGRSLLASVASSVRTSLIKREGKTFTFWPPDAPSEEMAAILKLVHTSRILVANLQ